MGDSLGFGLGGRGTLTVGIFIIRETVLADFGLCSPTYTRKEHLSDNAQDYPVILQPPTTAFFSVCLPMN